MVFELTDETRAMLEETKRVDTPAEFQALMSDATPEMDRVVTEVLAPSQPVSETLTELQDLYVAVRTYSTDLAAKNYGADRVERFKNAIRLGQTAVTWFAEGAKAGSFRNRTIEETVAASRQWRGRLSAIGGAAFWAQPSLAELFSDVNSSQTLDEEKADLEMLTGLVKKHRAALEPYGLTAEFVLEGEKLRDEASGRDVLAVLGLRSEAEARDLRNRVLTYAVWLGHEARMAGINACYEDAPKRRRFEAASFRNALRRLRSKRGSKADPKDIAPPGATPIDTGDGGPFLPE
ncbi:MAG: hypothetical protein HY791_14400 [Deltaproteobacteria bacterium]|nr:hypothetical protein [Deltaproteobacteria bacterium]